VNTDYFNRAAFRLKSMLTVV